MPSVYSRRVSEWTKVTRSGLTACGCAIALSALVSAQTTQGLISGRVVNLVSGRAVVSAEIRCDNLIVGAQNAARADPSGYFTFPLLSPGVYRLRVDAPNYQSQEVYQLAGPVAGRLEIQFGPRPLTDERRTRQYHSVFRPDS